MRVMDLTRAVEQDIFRIISGSASEIQQDVYVIGGYVRDFLLNENRSRDIDIVTTGNGIALAKKVSQNLKPQPKVSVFKQFGTAMFKYRDQEIEFVGARKESYRSNSRKPIVENGSIAEDQHRRDFTINSMAIGLNSFDYGYLIDPFDGLADLHRKLLRTPLDPLITYADDPLRMLRAIRFAGELNFVIEPSSFKAICQNRSRLSIVSVERIVGEFQKIMNSSKPSIGLGLLHKAGLLSMILPELSALEGVQEKEGHSHKDNFFHTLEVVDNVSKTSHSLWLRWAALLHDIGKALTKKYVVNTGWTFHAHEFVGARMIRSIFQRLKLPMGSTLKYVQKIVQYSSRPIALVGDEATDSALRRLLFDAGEDIDDLMLLCKADITTKNPEKQRRYRSNFILLEKKLCELEEKDRIRNWQPPISGEQIMEVFNLSPSPKVGLIKNAIKEAILDGEIANDRESVYCFMLKKGKELGLEKAN